MTLTEREKELILKALEIQSSWQNVQNEATKSVGIDKGMDGVIAYKKRFKEIRAELEALIKKVREND